MKKQIPWAMLTLVLVLSIAFSVQPISAATIQTVPANKEWTIKLSLPVVESSLTTEAVYVINEQGEKQAVTLKADNKTIYVQPPASGYTSGHTYELVVTEKLLGQARKSQKPIAKPYSMKFNVSNDYEIVHFAADGTKKVKDSYKTFEEAAKNLQDNEGIQLNGKVLKIKSGYVATSPSKVTLLYQAKALKDGNDYAGIQSNTLLHYVDSTEQYVEVAIGGQNLFVKHSDVTLLPSIQVPEPTYYTPTADGLKLVIYRPHTKTHEVIAVVGSNPAFMQMGQKYYSSDGFTFYDAAGNFVGEAYSYFQYVSPRTPSAYSAEELDTVILNRLAELEKQSPTTYKDATKNSRLIGIGAVLKEIEEEQHINALWILAMAINESQYGMSCHAQHNNNLFGFNVTDSAEKCKVGGNIGQNFYYPTVKENLAAYTASLNSYYLNPANKSSFRYHGAAFGNKMVGVNVRYASDPYWGIKNAGHMYRLDQALGGKMHQAHELAITSQNYVNVRKGPGTSYGSAYQYRLDGSIKRFDKMPLTLSNNPSSDAEWFRLISELPDYREDVYTRYDNVRKISTY